MESDIGGGVLGKGLVQTRKSRKKERRKEAAKMRFNPFGKNTAKIQAIESTGGHEVGGMPMDVASHADEEFPDEEVAQQTTTKKNRGSRFIMKSFFRKNASGSSGATSDRVPKLSVNRMQGINTLITDSFYQDKEDEADEWRSQMDLFADAYETESQSASQHRPSLTPAAEDIKTTYADDMELKWSLYAFVAN